MRYVSLQQSVMVDGAISKSLKIHRQQITISSIRDLHVNHCQYQHHHYHYRSLFDLCLSRGFAGHHNVF